MDMSKFRPESHVAQQSRRDKLRVQQSSYSLVQHLEGFPDSLEQNPDLVQVRNIRNSNLLYDPNVISSGIFHVSTNSHVLPPQRDAILLQQQESPTVEENRQMAGEEHSCDWMVGYAGGLAGRESNQNPMFVGEVMSNNAKQSNISSSTHYLDKPNYSAYQDAQSALSNPGSEISGQEIKKQNGDLHFISPSLYQNALQQDVTTASLPHQNAREVARCSWVDYCGNQASSLQFDNTGAWMNRSLALEHCQQWGCQLGSLAAKGTQELRTGACAGDASTQGLSLSLSSNPTPKFYDSAAKFTEGYGCGGFKELQDSKTSNTSQLCSIHKPSMTSKGNGMALQDAAGGTSTDLNRHTGPLGPFTGYATILKNSKFLKPAQELLDEFCVVTKSHHSQFVKVCENASEGISGEVSGSASADAANAVDMDTRAIKGNKSGALSSAFYSSNEMRVDVGVGCRSGETCRPDYQQKKAKLLFMQDEVCRRYKIYHQQMQMVVSAFESVAGLSAATPYISLALKTVARNFRCLKNAILDQIRHISRALGEELWSPTTGSSSSKCDINMSRLKYMGQKSGGVNMSFLEPQQHGWRPQRGLPERSVAILRAWLFEHFLHPYPTDTDKHMLATQTGLSRNQVSNWFINARVRVWKPMVEEIHMLESKGLAEGNQNLNRSDGKSNTEGGTSQPNVDQSINRSCMNAISDKHLGCSDMLVAGIAGDAHDAEQWNHEKRSRMDFHIPTSIEGSLMGFTPYQQRRLEIGGLGAVSLTLGLKHGESAQQHQQQYERQEDQLRRQYGGQMIHDFAG